MGTTDFDYSEQIGKQLDKMREAVLKYLKDDVVERMHGLTWY